MIKCKIEEMIQERGLKKKYICEKLNLDTSYFSRISKGQVIPNIETLYRIARFFGCHIDELYDFSEIGTDI